MMFRGVRLAVRGGREYAYAVREAPKAALLRLAPYCRAWCLRVPACTPGLYLRLCDGSEWACARSRGECRGRQRLCQRLRGECQGCPLLPLTPLVLFSLSLLHSIACVFLSVSLCVRVRVCVVCW
jgi:hypothetical protein